MLDIIKDIKAKQELRTLSDAYLEKKIEEYVKTHPSIKTLETISRRDRTIMIKRIRESCRKAYGMFSTKKRKKRDKLLNEYAKNPNSLNLQELMNTHKSTKERWAIYSTIFEKIFAITGKPSSILDLGCGMNPLAFSFMNLEKVDYHAYDLSLEDLEFIKEFYKVIKQKITIKEVDLLEPKKISFPKTDIVFMLKLLDHIDLHRNHRLSEELLKQLKAKKLVISFSAKTLSYKPMRHPQRGWIERLLNRLRYRWDVIQTNGEIFYIARKA